MLGFQPTRHTDEETHQQPYNLAASSFYVHVSTTATAKKTLSPPLPKTARNLLGFIGRANAPPQQEVATEE